MADDPDLSTWYPKQKAADRMHVTLKTVERWGLAGKTPSGLPLQSALWRRQHGPAIVVYFPEDVDRIAQERRPGPLPPFLVPATEGPNGNGLAQIESTLDSTAIQLAPAALENLLVATWVRVMSGMSQTFEPYLTLREASRAKHLSQAHLRRLCEEGRLKAVRDRGWRIDPRALRQL